MISVSGMRGIVGTDLTPELVARHAAALGAWAGRAGKPLVVLGRDSRTSGAMFAHAAIAGLMSVGLRRHRPRHRPDAHHPARRRAPPRRRRAHPHRQPQPDRVERAQAGRARTASFSTPRPARAVRALAEAGPARAGWDGLGRASRSTPRRSSATSTWSSRCPRSTSTLIRRAPVPRGARLCPRRRRRRHPEPAGAAGLPRRGDQPRDRRPVSAGAGADSRKPGRARPSWSRSSGADIGMAVDPDVDRLALVDERGHPIGEDYTLAFAVRAVLGRRREVGKPGSRRAVARTVCCQPLDLPRRRRCGHGRRARFLRAPVGEANVAQTIKEEGAVIGGEGNGGVILPALHIGRDAPARGGVDLAVSCA